MQTITAIILTYNEELHSIPSATRGAIDYFMDGKQGFVWHVLQGFWYRFLVEPKIWEIKRDLSPALSKERGSKKGDNEKIVAFIREKYNISD